MVKQIICYSLENSNAVNRTKLHRELYGYKDISNHGKYSYQRTGILQSTKSKKITDVVILTSKNQSNKIIKILEKYMAKTYVFDIITK